MLQKSLFTKQEIITQIQKIYNICITKIETETRGSANIFYIYDNKNTKYVLKEFEPACNEQNVIKEIKIINHLRKHNIPVPEYIKTIHNNYYFTHKGRTVILMKYIDGYTKSSNTGNKEQVIESAMLLGKILKALETFEEMKADNIEPLCDKTKLAKSKEEFKNLLTELTDDEIDKKIKVDINDRLKIIEKLEKIDLSGMRQITMKNSHGDYSIMQFIYENEKVVAVLDFAKARKMPLCWEIIRSYTYIDEKCADGKIDLENLKLYIDEVGKFVEIKDVDLKWMLWFYLIQLVCSSFGFKEFLRDRDLRELVEFGFWRTKMCRELSGLVELD